MDKIIQKRIRISQIEELHLKSLKLHLDIKTDQELFQYLIQSKIEEVTLKKSNYFSEEISKTINRANQKVYREIKNSYNELFLIGHITFQTLLIKVLNDVYDVKVSSEEMDLLKHSAVEDLVNHEFSEFIKSTVKKMEEQIEDI